MRSPNRLVGSALGAVYLLIGLIGFVIPGGGLLLNILQLNVVSNIVHILVGAALLLAALSSAQAALTVNTVVGTALLVLGLAGLFLLDTSLNILPLDAMGNALHFASAVPLLAAGLGADRASPVGDSDR